MRRSDGIEGKRHVVLALFEGASDEIRSEEWVECARQLPETNCYVMVKGSDGEVVKSIFWKDQLRPLAQYHKNCEPSYFQDERTKEFLHDVTHWRYFNWVKEKE